MSVTRKNITVEINGQDVTLSREDATEVYNVICQTFGIYALLSTVATPEEKVVSHGIGLDEQ